MAGELLSVADLAAALEKSAVVLLDVRPAHEFSAGHIPGSWPVPITDLPARIRDPLDDPCRRLRDRSALVAVVAGGADQLGSATTMLAEIHIDAYGVAGEVRAWSRSGRPLNRGAAGEAGTGAVRSGG